MDVLKLEKVLAEGNWPSWRLYVMRHYMCIFFGPPSDYGFEETITAHDPDRKIVCRYGKWSHTEISVNGKTGEFVSFLLLNYVGSLPTRLSDSNELIVKEAPVEEGIPFFSLEGLPAASDYLGYMHDDLSDDVLVQTGTDFIHVILLDLVAVRYVRVSSNFMIGISKTGKWAVAHFDHLDEDSVKEFEDHVASCKDPSHKSIVERFTGFVRSWVS